MKVILCLDNKNGMMFNHRRQSQDLILREHIRKMCHNLEAELLMNEYSYKLFDADPMNPISGGDMEDIYVTIGVSEELLKYAAAGEFCFVEDQELKPYQDKIEEIIVYRWNKVYPADMYLDIDLSSWKLRESTDFAGSSHDKITQERYVK